MQDVRASLKLGALGLSRDRKIVLATGVAAAATGMMTACGQPEICGESMPVVAMSHNLANPIERSRSEALARRISDIAPDFAGVQECAQCEDFVLQLPPRYRMAAEARAGVAILYDSSLWEVEASGALQLGDNDDGWGKRFASWARLAHLDTGRCLYVYSTHWCVPIRRPDDRCDTERQLEYADEILGHIFRSHPRVPAILTGDFNVFDGFEDGEVIRALVDAGLTDVFRAVDPDEDGTTFQGNDWAPPGRLDYLFATDPAEVFSSFIDFDREASDHYAVIGELALGR